MKINEIYYTLNGEGIHAGLPTMLVRVQGCNLCCIYCDTKYAQEEGGYDWSLKTLLSRCWAKRVLITGGEPLLQPDLHEVVEALKEQSIEVEIETNGSIEPPTWWEDVDCWSVDIKCPSSGMHNMSRRVWLSARPRDQVKFVVANQEDLDFVLETALSTRYIAPTVLISPTYPWTQEWLHKCVEFCKRYGFRLSLQQHKIIYGDTRGV